MDNWFKNRFKTRLKIKKDLPAFLICLGAWLGIVFLTGTGCWFQGIIGVPCPGCGTSRALGALWAGDWEAALRWHPLIFLTLSGGPILTLIWLFKRPFFFTAWGKGMLGIILALYLGVYGYRMITLYPHMAPMNPLPTALWRLILHYLPL